MTDPRLLELVAAVRRDPARAGPLCDWMDEQGWTLADVLRLYATAPGGETEWALADGDTATHEHMGVPMKRAPKVPPAEDDSLRCVLVEWLRRNEDPRDVCVEQCSVVKLPWRAVKPWQLYDATPHPKTYLRESDARRDLKRSVLRLFGVVDGVPAQDLIYPPSQRKAVAGVRAFLEGTGAFDRK